MNVCKFPTKRKKFIYMLNGETLLFTYLLEIHLYVLSPPFGSNGVGRGQVGLSKVLNPDLYHYFGILCLHARKNFGTNFFF